MSSSITDSPLVQSIVQNPLNLFLLAIFLYLLVPIVMPTSISTLTPTVKSARGLAQSYSYLPTDHPRSAEWRKYTPKLLAIYDGTDGEANGEAARQGRSSGGEDANKGKILLSINRKVFDVSSGARFYGIGGPYGNFAGRDASRGMAKQSFDQGERRREWECNVAVCVD